MSNNQSYRHQLRTWLKEQIEDEDEVQLPLLVEQAIEHFSRDKSFIQAFLREMLRPIVYDIVSQLVRNTRQVVLGDELVSRELLSQRARKNRSRWESWLEHAGDRHIRLLDMTRDDLLKAASERRQRADTEIKLATLWESLAKNLRDGERLRDRFTAEEIDARFAQLEAVPV